MLRTAVFVFALASPAAADIGEVSNCQLISDLIVGSVRCDVENLSSTAIARIFFEMKVFEEGRTVPWVALGSEQYPESVSVSGGVEPGETRNIFFAFDTVPKEANPDRLRIEVTPVKFLDVNGDEIGSQ